MSFPPLFNNNNNNNNNNKSNDDKTPKSPKAKGHNIKSSLTDLIWNDRLADTSRFLPPKSAAAAAVRGRREQTAKEEKEERRLLPTVPFASEDNNTTNSSRNSSSDQKRNQKQKRMPSYHRRGSNFDYSHAHPDDSEAAEPGTSNLLISIFTLIATIVGGGELSVPFAFAKMGGVVWGMLWMLLAAVCTDQSCLMLCWCARAPYLGYTVATQQQKRQNQQKPEPKPQNQFLLLSSYGQVGKKAFGSVMEVAISALLFVFLVFVLVAYMVLAKDIWTPIVLQMKQQTQTQFTQQQTQFIQQQDPTTTTNLDQQYGPYILLGIVLCLCPFFLQHTLHALRFNCYVGFFSVSTLCLVLCHHALVPPSSSSSDGNDTPTLTPYEVFTDYEFWFRPPESIRDVLTSFPILMLSLLCHFNVNPIQKALVEPTPRRMERVVHVAVSACTVLMILFGVGGYAYVLVNNNTDNNNQVQGNILLNCEAAQNQQQQQSMDIMLLMGRIGCGITVLMAQCVMMLPCRDSLLEVVDIALFHSGNNNATSDVFLTTTRTKSAFRKGSVAFVAAQDSFVFDDNDDDNSNEEEEEENQEEETESKDENDKIEHRQRENATQQKDEEAPIVNNETEESPLLKNQSSRKNNSRSFRRQDSSKLSIRPHSISESTFVHYFVTILIVAVAYGFAVSVPGVAVVWSLCGSSMAFSMAFILPAACYLKLMPSSSTEECFNGDERLGWTSQPNKGFAWILLVFSVLGAIVCTMQTIQSLV